MGRAGASRPDLFLWSASKPLTPPPFFFGFWLHSEKPIGSVHSAGTKRMGHKTDHKHSAIRMFIPLIAIGVFAAVRSHAGYITEQQKITGCQRIQLHAAETSDCSCKANKCEPWRYAALSEYLACDEVMPGEQGQRGCKSVAKMIGTKGVCMMAINKDIEKRLNQCEAWAYAEAMVCIALAPPLSPLTPFVCSSVLAWGLRDCHNDWVLPQCSLVQCVQDGSFRLEITRPVATGFDTTLLPASRQCFGEGG